MSSAVSLPAFAAAIRTSVNETLKEGGRTGTSGSGHARLRSGLVIAEIAVALVLLAASGLLLRSFEKMREADLGYRPDHSVVAAYSLPRKQYSKQSAVDQFNHEVLRPRSVDPWRHQRRAYFLPARQRQSGQFRFRRRRVCSGETRESSIWRRRVGIQGNIFQAMGIRFCSVAGCLPKPTTIRRDSWSSSSITNSPSSPGPDKIPSANAYGLARRTC